MNTKMTLTQFVEDWIIKNDTLICGLLSDAERIVEQHYEDHGAYYCVDIMADQIFSDLTAYDKDGLLTDILYADYVDLKSIASVYIDGALKAKGLDSPFFY